MSELLGREKKAHLANRECSWKEQRKGKSKFDVRETTNTNVLDSLISLACSLSRYQLQLQVNVILSWEARTKTGWI